LPRAWARQGTMVQAVNWSRRFRRSFGTAAAARVAAGRLAEARAALVAGAAFFLADAILAVARVATGATRARGGRGRGQRSGDRDRCRQQQQGERRQQGSRHDGLLKNEWLNKKTIRKPLERFTPAKHRASPDGGCRRAPDVFPRKPEPRSVDRPPSVPMKWPGRIRSTCGP